MTVSLNANKGNRFLGGADFSVFLFEVKEFLLASDETRKKKVEKVPWRRRFDVRVVTTSHKRRMKSSAVKSLWAWFVNSPFQSRLLYTTCVCVFVCTAHTSLYPGLASYSS
jgi:hypothetical protein